MFIFFFCKVTVKPAMNLQNSGGVEELQSQLLRGNLQKILFEISDVFLLSLYERSDFIQKNSKYSALVTSVLWR